MKHLTTKDSLSRRQFIQAAGGTIGLLTLPRLTSISNLAVAADTAHFFLHIYVQDGLDASALFDSRPSSFTQAGKIHNYSGGEPFEWRGNNGHMTLARKPTEGLMMFKDDISIINGVIMNVAFDGHEQNALTMFTGNPFGGSWLTPQISQSGTPLDYLQIGRLLFAGGINNAATGLASDSSGVKALLAALAGTKSTTPINESVLEKNFRSLAEGPNPQSVVGRGAASMLQGLTDSKTLVKLLQTVQPPDQNLSAVVSDVHLMMEFLKRGITRSLHYSPSIGLSLDYHSENDCAKIPETYPIVTGTIADILKTLKSTEFDSGRSFLDVTTIVVSSEFSRTMRQEGRPIDKTGTDHNPLGNSILIGGKGIKKGCVFGGTDLDSLANNTFTNIPAYHNRFDVGLLKAMGRPIDYATGLPLPVGTVTDYDPDTFITYPSIANTIMDLFQLPKELRWDLGRNLPKARTLPFLLGA